MLGVCLGAMDLNLNCRREQEAGAQKSELRTSSGVVSLHGDSSAALEIVRL